MKVLPKNNNFKLWVKNKSQNFTVNYEFCRKNKCQVLRQIMNFKFWRKNKCQILPEIMNFKFWRKNKSLNFTANFEFQILAQK